MGKPPIMYQSWKSLDPAKRYCLADTMVLLQIYRRDLRLTAMTDSVLDGRTLLIIPEIVSNAGTYFIKKSQIPHLQNSSTGAMSPVKFTKLTSGQ